MATKKSKTNVARSAKKQSFKFKWWMVLVFVLFIGGIGLVVMRYSQAAMVRTWTSEDGNEVRRFSSAVSADDPVLPGKFQEVIEFSNTGGAVLLSAPSKEALTIADANQKVLTACWAMRSSSKYHPGGNSMGYNQVQYKPGSQLPNQNKSSRETAEVMVVAKSDSGVHLQEKITVDSLVEADGNYKKYCRNISGIQQQNLNNFRLEAFVIGGVARVNKVSLSQVKTSKLSSDDNATTGYSGKGTVQVTKYQDPSLSANGNRVLSSPSPNSVAPGNVSNCIYVDSRFKSGGIVPGACSGSLQQWKFGVDSAKSKYYICDELESLPAGYKIKYYTYAFSNTDISDEKSYSRVKVANNGYCSSSTFPVKDGVTTFIDVIYTKK